MTIFDPSNVLVLPYELFLTEPKEFVGEILDFCEVSRSEALLDSLRYNERMNASLSGISLALKRQFNAVVGGRRFRRRGRVAQLNVKVRHMLEQLDRRMPKTWKSASNRQLRGELDALVAKDYFAESNRRTAELTGLDLARYGYEMGR